jgi:hypothetical protein
MNDDKSRPDRPERAEKESWRLPSKDITPVLKGWDYESGTINVRKINGVDGAPKLQMRLDLGLLQMEMNGRPDGSRPHGFESLLEYHEDQLADYRRMNGSDIGFALSSEQCQQLREESLMYYQRYLSLFVLEEFSGVVRDTSRNLRVLDLCGKFGIDEQDRLMLEQYRPYITMMNVRAAASLHLKAKRPNDAQRTVEKGLEGIQEFFSKFGQDEAFSHSNEVRVLKRFAREIRKKLPVSPMQKLQRKLERAVKNEEYEEAARLRDKIVTLQNRPPGASSKQEAK